MMQVTIILSDRSILVHVQFYLLLAWSYYVHLLYISALQNAFFTVIIWYLKIIQSLVIEVNPLSRKELYLSCSTLPPRAPNLFQDSGLLSSMKNT